MDGLYFPFLDGALRYDCVRCGARCCRGLGFGVGRAELVPLVRRRPQLAPFVQPAGAHAAIIDFTDGCWFLRGDGRCRVEAEDGRAAKPSVCRLFPFTRIYRIGAVTVIEPHLLVCPLEDARGGGITWREVADELAACGPEMPTLSAQPPAGLPDDWAERERAFLARTESLLDAPDPLALLATEATAERLAGLRAAWRRALALDEAEAARREAEVARPLALLAPMLRFATLFAIGGGAYPKLAARLPALLLAHALFAGLAARALGGAPSLRSLGELWRATVFEREVLARWDAPCAIVRPAKASDLPPPADAAWARLLARLDAGAPRLGAAFDDAVADLEPSLRPLLLRALAARFAALRF